MAINISVRELSCEPFSAASPLKVLSVVALVWGLHYLGISCEDKQSRRLQLPPKTHNPPPFAHPTPHTAAPTPQSCCSAVQGYLFTDEPLSRWRHTTRGNNQEERKKSYEEQRRERQKEREREGEKRRTESRRCDKDRKRVGEGKSSLRESNEKKNKVREKQAKQRHMKEGGRKCIWTFKSVNRKNVLLYYSMFF